MSVWNWCTRIISWAKGKYDLDELARRLDMSVEELKAFKPTYREFTIPKRRGGHRNISAPTPETKQLQRRILRRLLAKLRVHPAATGFEKGKSIVDNARPHIGKAVIVRMDLVDFFPSIKSSRVKKYFRAIGWTREAAKTLTKLTTHEGSLPQGAPTSPRLSNLVSYLFDAQIAGSAKTLNANYTRYADDITLSFQVDGGNEIHLLQAIVYDLCFYSGYKVHKKKGGVRRQHQQQLVTGLVVNESVRLPRETRRRLRAVMHRMKTSQQDPLAPKPTMTPDQLAGWSSLMKMIDRG